MAEAVPGILFTTLPDGYCDYVSARAYEFTGRPVGSFEGFGWLLAIHDQDREPVRQSWMQSAATGAPFLVEYRMCTADGTYRWMQVRAEPMMGDDGRIVKWFGVCADIDDHKRLQQNLAARSSELTRSNEELQRFAYAAAHDLQEPLRTVGAMSELLARQCVDVLDAESQELLRYIDGGVKRMSSLIRDLLDYSRISTVGAILPKPIDANSMVKIALMNLKAQIVQTEAVVTTDILPSVMADEQLALVFQNLVGNALKYRSNERPSIHIAADRHNEEYIFSVRDNGIGIAREDADKVFEVFHRLHTRSEYEGSGVGLAICRKILERHGGQIWVESTKGAGATFFFRLRAA
jgi:PAS domain S-box-containing protein